MGRHWVRCRPLSRATRTLPDHRTTKLPAVILIPDGVSEHPADTRTKRTTAPHVNPSLPPRGFPSVARTVISAVTSAAA